MHLENNLLSIEAESEKSHEESGNTFHIRERSFGKFRRTVRLPKNINEDSVSAAMEHGVLTITVAKQEKAKAKRICIQ